MSAPLTFSSALSKNVVEYPSSFDSSKEEAWWEEDLDNQPGPDELQGAFVREQVERILSKPSPKIELAEKLKRVICPDPFDQFDPEAFKSQLISACQNPKT